MSHKWKKYFPRPFNQIVFAAPYSYVCYDVIGWWCVLLLVPTTLALLTGHGKFMDLGAWDRAADDETLEFIIKPLEGRVPTYWYDLAGLAVTGIAVTLAAGLVIGFSNPLAGGVLALSGGLKAAAYAIGGNTERGEFLTGFLLYLVLSFYV